jgi:hypothetical protein
MIFSSPNLKFSANQPFYPPLKASLTSTKGVLTSSFTQVKSPLATTKSEIKELGLPLKVI